MRSSLQTMVLVLKLAMLSLASLAAARAPAVKYAKAMVVFGDSVSDTGNLFKLLDVPDKDVYYHGRFSNGPNWVDVVQEKVKKLEVKNYAFGGATACLDLKAYSPVHAVPEQVTTFLTGKRRAELPKNRLVVLFIGPNDITAGFASGTVTNVSSALAFASKVAGCIVTQVTRLAQAGEKRVIIFNLPPLELTPLVSSNPFKASIAQFIGLFNQGLSQGIAGLQAALPSTDLAVYDVHASLTAGFRNASALGFTNTTAPCVVGSGSLVLNGNDTVCAHPNKYVWFDLQHPSAAVHKKVIAKDFLAYLRGKKIVPK